MNYALNPDAPEFHPLLTDAVQDGLMRMNKTIRTSNCFPRGASYDIYKTYTDFGTVTCKISENVVVQSNQIVVAELPQVKLKSDVNVNDGNNTDKIIHVNDSLLDRINTNIDSLNGANQPNEQFQRRMGANVSSWNKAPVIAKIRVGDALFIGVKNLPRPQLTFKDSVDNSFSLWVPKIFEKPNNIKPLALNIIYNSDKEAIGYEHPYKVELDMYKPPLDLILPAQQPEFPQPLNATPLTIIDTEPGLVTLIEHLRTCTEIAVDVEHHSYRSYQGFTCLIQITTDTGGDFIVDTIAIREYIYKLNEIFTDPKIIKILHGATSDVQWLQRDFGVYIVGLFDTFHAGRVLKIPVVSLKNLLALYCTMDIDKKYQLADWRIRPLPAEMIEYARMDTHYLLYVYRMMKLQLLQRAAMVPTLLQSVFEMSRQTCYLTYSKPVLHDDCHMEMYIRSKKRFTSQQLSALRMLYIWRDQHARELDEGPPYLIPNHMLLNLAERLPRELQGINACCSPMPPFVKIHLVTIHRMILSCCQLPPEPVLYEIPAGVRMMMDPNPQAPINVHDLTEYPEIIEEDIDLDVAWALLDETNDSRGVRFDTQPDIVTFAVTPAVAKASEGAAEASEGTADVSEGAAEVSEAAAVAPELADRNPSVKSNLNVDAKMFFPPYDRYFCYRSYAQWEEIKEFKAKEAKVTALSQGNELIKTEVLDKLQAQRDAAEASAASTAFEEPAVKEEERTVETEADKETDNKAKKLSKRRHQVEVKLQAQRDAAEASAVTTAPEEPAVNEEESTVETEADKETDNKTKKLSKRRHQVEKPAAIQPADDKKKEPQKSGHEHRDVIKSFHYKNVNYKKFFSDDKAHNQPKLKFKKS